jgi:hypothetical protein
LDGPIDRGVDHEPIRVEENGQLLDDVDIDLVLLLGAAVGHHDRKVRGRRWFRLPGADSLHEVESDGLLLDDDSLIVNEVL